MANLESAAYWQTLINQGLIKFFLLKALREEDLYGYIIGKKIEEASWGACRPAQGTLYPALAHLENDGYVTVYNTKYHGRERKVYHITAKGNQAFRVAAKAYGETLPLLGKAIVL